MRRRCKKWTAVFLAVCIFIFVETGLAAAPQEAPEGEAESSEAGSGEREDEVSEPGTPDGSGGTRAAATEVEGNPSAIVVYDFAWLKKALNEDNGYTLVYLGADIETTEGIIIHASKKVVTIDGVPPGAKPEERRTLTQHSSTALSGIIRAEGVTSLTRNITLQNMNIIGKNFYGVASSSGISGVTITHRNITYTGPQPVYNLGGTTRFIDSAYILRPSGATPTHELAETLHAEMGGNVDIDAGDTTFSVLWLTGTDSTLTLLEGANVRVNTVNYFIFGPYSPDVTLEYNSRLTVINRRGFTYATQSVGSVTLAERSSLRLEQNSTELYAALRVSKLFQMQPDSSAVISRTGTNGLAIMMTGLNGQVILDRPRRAVFYSSGGTLIRFTGPGTLYAAVAAVNIWQNAPWPADDYSAGQPSHIWNKTGAEELVFTGSYYDLLTQGLTHNLTEGDPVESTLNQQNLNLEKAKLVSFGSIALEVDPVAGNPSVITGRTEPDALLYAHYPLPDGGNGSLSGEANEVGWFSLTVPEGELARDNHVTMLAGRDLLWTRQRGVVREGVEGYLTLFETPDSIRFTSIAVPAESVTVGRYEPLAITVSDTRSVPLPWRLDASLERPLSALVEGSWRELPCELFFDDPYKGPLPLNGEPVTIYEQGGGQEGDTELFWDKNEGILLRVMAGEVYSADYSGMLLWTLVSGP